MLQQNTEQIKDPRQFLGEYEKAIRQEQETVVTTLKSELGRTKHHLDEAKARLEKCAIYEEISKKIDNRKAQQVLEITIEDTELLKLIETFAQQYQKDVNTMIMFLISSLFYSDKGRHALAYMMAQLNNNGQPTGK